MNGSEMLLVIFVAFMLFGGKRLPEMARKWGRTMRDLRRAFEEMKKQMGMEELEGMTRSPSPQTNSQIDELKREILALKKEIGLKELDDLAKMPSIELKEKGKEPPPN